MTSSEDPIRAVTRYYAARAPVYDETAGYADAKAELLRAPIKSRYQRLFSGQRVLEVACGTGYWTAVVGEVARSVCAIDVSPAMLSIATKRCQHLGNVRLQRADAYELEGVPGDFTSAFAIWWWSHVPKARLASFLRVLHDRLTPGATVLFVDQLPSEPSATRHADGNTYVQRELPDGRSFLIVKNYPTERDVVGALADIATDISYVELPDEMSWSVSYRTLPERAC